MQYLHIAVSVIFFASLSAYSAPKAAVKLYNSGQLNTIAYDIKPRSAFNTPENLETYYKHGGGETTIAADYDGNGGWLNWWNDGNGNSFSNRTDKLLEVFAARGKKNVLNLRISYGKSRTTQEWIDSLVKLLNDYKITPKMVTIAFPYKPESTDAFHKAHPEYELALCECHFLHDFQTRDKFIADIVERAAYLRYVNLDWSNLFDADLTKEDIAKIKSAKIEVRMSGGSDNADEIADGIKLGADAWCTWGVHPKDALTRNGPIHTLHLTKRFRFLPQK